MSFLSDIDGHLSVIEIFAGGQDWSGIVDNLSWRSAMALHGRVVHGDVQGEAADNTALIIGYRAYAGLSLGIEPDVAIKCLDQIINSKAYLPVHQMMFRVHMAQYQWHFGDKTYAYGHIMQALEIAQELPNNRRDLAIVELIRCIFGVRDGLGESDVNYKDARRQLRDIAVRLRPNRLYGDSWDLRRLTYLWLAITHNANSNEYRTRFYLGRAGRVGKAIDWRHEAARPVPYAAPTLPRVGADQT